MAAAEKGTMPLHVRARPLQYEYDPRDRDRDRDSSAAGRPPVRVRRWRTQQYALVALLAAFALYGLSASFLAHPHPQKSADPDRVAPLGASDAILEQCARLRNVPGPGPSSESDLLHRDRSDRFEPGTRPTLIKNVTLWTGARNGTEIVYGDIYLDKGLVQSIGYIPEAWYTSRDTDVVDANGGWVTPGLGTYVSAGSSPPSSRVLTETELNTANCALCS